jgi:hypothetical protein
MSDDPWHYWPQKPPARSVRVEVISPKPGQDPAACTDEPRVIAVDDLPPEANIAYTYWRPFY